MVSGMIACWCSWHAKGYSEVGNSQLYYFAVAFVMSEPSRGLVPSEECNKEGPNYFGFYTHEVAELLSDNEDLPLSSFQSSQLSGEVRDRNDGNKVNTVKSYDSLFSNGIGAGFSDLKKERLKRLLRQSVTVLMQEVDEMLEPVMNARQLQFYLSKKKHPLSPGATSDVDAGTPPNKKAKMSSSSSSTGVQVHASPVSCRSSREDVEPENKNPKSFDVTLSEKEVNVFEKNCAHCPQWRTGPQGLKVNDDLKLLLDNVASLHVEETVKKHAVELSKTLGHMEQQLEELLDTVMAKCRPMTIAEKQRLCSMIQNLPPKNLNRIAEIIRRDKPLETHNDKEIFVDLEEVDNLKLWRIYYYVEAVVNARKLSM